ncbi:hypothetical protein [Streptomyces sp. NBC_00620]|uniref:hypothetical protein n=1 Tax=Streptomyces sp. NBC_00620 TaxID=2903666 RepID=UPI0022518A48|nr:hypothetical protein [Streptomyces sp. NBC_00620]MCX4976475.1 hypothetical protein [Streptomyces sp. NBC_00620]
MSTTLVPVPDAEADDDQAQLTELEATIALIACGLRHGKSRACDRHRKKGETLLRIASTGAVDALAAAICGCEHRRSCAPCASKARQIIDAYNEEAE